LIPAAHVVRFSPSSHHSAVNIHRTLPTGK
jgi:hypothetical protein